MECRAALNISRNMQTGVVTINSLDMRHNHVVGKRFENQYACNRVIPEAGVEEIKKMAEPMDWDVRDDLHIARLPAFKKPSKKAQKQPRYTLTQPFDIDWMRNHTCVECGCLCEPAKIDDVRPCTNCGLPAHRSHEDFLPDARYVCSNCTDTMARITIEEMSLE